MITTERKNYLTSQYIWSIQSDGVWYVQAEKSVNCSNKQQFHRVTREAVVRVRRLINDMIMNGDEYMFIADALYLELMGGISTDAPIVESDHETLLQEIADNTESASGHLARVANNLETLTKEKYTMQTNPNTAIETKTVIFGRDAADMSEQDLIDAIKRVESDIAKLKEVKTTSKKIASNIERLHEQLEAIVAVLDAR